MSSDVVLTSALRSNLLSLQNTQRLIDDTQLRLATGLKVNSALDNPQNFFAAQSLNNRAGDLSRLLDGISQSIRTIEEANTGVTALTGLLEQADSIATSAREELSASGSNEATVVGNVDLRDIDDLTDLTGVDTTDRIQLFAVEDDGTAVTLSASTVTITAGDSIEQFITAINDITNTDDDSQAFEASLNDQGYLQIKSLQGGNARIEFQVAAGTVNADLASGLGFSYLNVNESAGNALITAPNRAGITFSRTSAIQSRVLYETENGSQVVADRSTALNALVDSGGTSLDFTGDATDDIVISIDGGDLVSLGNTTTNTIQGVVDTINDSSDLNTKIRASYDETTGVLSIEQLDSSIKSVQIGARDVIATANDAAIGFDFGVIGYSGDLEAANNAAANVEIENIVFGKSSSVIAGLEEDYNTVLEQIDAIVVDAQYRGINLLAGDDLTTFFNEDRTSTLSTTGVDFSAFGLGLSDANFRNENLAITSQDQVREAILSVRAFGNSIANDLTIIQTRRDFTESTINTLEAGADDLTVADQNEEGANLLALQTRQTLGVTSLSLASQSQQAVLRLF
jgi:flagellin-like hook-associated protein FlgL